MQSLSTIIVLTAFFQVSHSATVPPQFLAHPQVEALTSSTDSHYLLQHDFLQCFALGEFADMEDAAKIFFENHYVYSRNFIKFLTTVVEKVDEPAVAKPILENIEEENGNYEQEDIDELTSFGIKQDWYNGIPHKILARRFLNAVGVNVSALGRHNAKAGITFTNYMLDAYEKANRCEALAIIGFAIEQTVSELYRFLWQGLQNFTTLSPDDYVFFPLHILIDDGHSDLLKLAFKHYWEQDHTECERASDVVQAVMDRRVNMFDEVRQQIEISQGHRCRLPYSSYNKSVEPPEAFHLITKPTVSTVSVDHAVRQAQRETLRKMQSNVQSGWTMTQRMAMSARILADQGHGGTLSGQITCRDKGNMWATPYDLPLEIVSAKDFLLLNSNLVVLQGKGFPNRATRFHFHVYEKRPDIKCLIHTHPPHASALAMTGEPLHVAHMDVMAFYEDVQHLKTWPGIPFGDDEGEIISNVLKDKWSALLAHHGLIVGGRTIEEATYRAYFFERAAKMQLEAMAAKRRLPVVNPALGRKARDWRISEGPVQAHFNGWAKIALRNGHSDAI